MKETFQAKIPGNRFSTTTRDTGFQGGRIEIHFTLFVGARRGNVLLDDLLTVGIQRVVNR